ncbi:MAG: hypothetical protein EBX59_09205 [Betaproteobacteria bacterium]|nr:hypothetical protein [Betaproteobacteria bacterium]
MEPHLDASAWFEPSPTSMKAIRSAQQESSESRIGNACIPSGTSDVIDIVIRKRWRFIKNILDTR